MYSLHRDRLKTLRHIMARVIDQRAHGVGRQCRTRIGSEESIQGCNLLEGGIEPLVIRRGRENDRHPIVDRGHEVIRLCGDNRTGFKRFPFSRRPMFPQPSKSERLLTPNPIHIGCFARPWICHS